MKEKLNIFGSRMNEIGIGKFKHSKKIGLLAQKSIPNSGNTIQPSV